MALTFLNIYLKIVHFLLLIFYLYINCVAFIFVSQNSIRRHLRITNKWITEWEYGERIVVKLRNLPSATTGVFSGLGDRNIDEGNWGRTQTFIKPGNMLQMRKEHNSFLMKET